MTVIVNGEQSHIVRQKDVAISMVVNMISLRYNLFHDSRVKVSFFHFRSPFA